MNPNVVAAVDIGAGSGAKMGLFDSNQKMIVDGFLPVENYGESSDELVANIASEIKAMFERAEVSADNLSAVGLCSPGLFNSDFSFRSVANVPILRDCNLPKSITELMGVPAAIGNDADIGGLAEWAMVKAELLFWVLGGGWGGAWVTADGVVLHPSIDWSGEDEDLHPTNEPGYAIALLKDIVKDALKEEGASWDAFEKLATEEYTEQNMSGPSGRTDAIRAQVVISGPGRWLIFKTLALLDENFEAGLSGDDKKALANSSDGGAVISKLGEAGNAVALAADRVFATLLAATAEIVLDSTTDDKSKLLPIYMSGGPSRALNLFKSRTEQLLRERGYNCELTPSLVEGSGQSANLLGAAVLASKLVTTDN